MRVACGFSRSAEEREHSGYDRRGALCSFLPVRQLERARERERACRSPPGFDPMARVVSTPPGRRASDVSIDLDLQGDALFVQFARAIVKPIASGGRKRELRRVADELLGQIGAAQPSNLALGVGMAVVALIGSTEKADLGQDVDAVTRFLQIIQWEDGFKGLRRIRVFFACSGAALLSLFEGGITSENGAFVAIRATSPLRTRE